VGRDTGDGCVNQPRALKLLGAPTCCLVCTRLTTPPHAATRTLPGHRGAVQCVDFHPAGEFCASGAQDGTLRVWDARAARGCVATYRGHGTSPVCGLAFSPDGRWVVSGSQDGGVALWDVAGGKALCNLAPPTGDAVTSIQFHPHQLLLATCAADRSARVWCLETFRPVMDVTTQTAGPPRVCAFSPCGAALLLACPEGLLCCGWEPTTAFDDVAVPWKAVADAHCTGGRLLVASTHTSFVSVWVGDLARLAPWAAQGESHGDGIAAAAASGSPAKDMSPLIKGAVAAPQPWRGSPCVTPTKARGAAAPAGASQRVGGPIAGESQSPGWSKPARGSSALAVTSGEHGGGDASTVAASPPHRTSMASLGNGVQNLSLSSSWNLGPSELRAAMRGVSPGQQDGGADGRDGMAQQPLQQQPSARPNAPPPQGARPAAQPRPPVPESSELSALNAAIEEHSQVAVVLALRHSTVTALHSALARGDPHSCAALLARAAADPVAVSDALVGGMGSLMTLDGCAAVVPHLRPLLFAAPGVEVCEAHVAVGVATLEEYTVRPCAMRGQSCRLIQQTALTLRLRRFA
jgi:hypothetical protein